MTLGIVISDLHLDWTTSGVSRFEEGDRALTAAAADAVRSKANFFVFCGDLCNPDSGSCVFRCVASAARIASRLGRHGIPSYWLTGNHDVIEDGSGGSTLMPLAFLPLTRVMDRPMLIELAGYDLAFLPFVATSRGYDSAKVVDVPSLSSSRHPLIVFSHLHLRGIQPGEETQEMPRGRDIWLPDQQLAEVAKRRRVVVVSGHYHRRQTHKTPAGLEVHVVGAPLRFTHGEEHHEPAYLRINL